MRTLSLGRFLVLFAAVFLVLPAAAFGRDVNWNDSWDEALTAAQREEKNIFVLITAPSWCGWCVRLEQNVLSKSAFQEYVSKNYIALKLLDVVDGKRNSELDRFDFSGFPTVQLFDSNGNLIGDSYTQDLNEMLSNLKANVDAVGKFRPSLTDLILPEQYAQSGGGEYINNGDGSWTVTISGTEVMYMIRDYDYDYLYLAHPSDGSVIALSMTGNDAHLGKVTDGEWGWTDLPNVVRFGGDPYFED